jgi:hypothetical protein
MRSSFLGFVVFVVVGSFASACGSSDGPEEDACFYRGQVFPVGAEFPAGDGCNACTCQPDLSVSCTEVPCPDADIPDAGAPADAGGDADAGALADAGDAG